MNGSHVSKKREQNPNYRERVLAAAPGLQILPIGVILCHPEIFLYFEIDDASQIV
jgi:hypothetical protein